MLQRVLLLLLLTRFLHLIKASAHFSRHNTGTSASATGAAISYDDHASSWQPMPTHNNWIILQSASATSQTVPSKRHAELPYANAAHSRAPTPQHRLPVNYYAAYNHSAGNYQQPQPSPLPLQSIATTTTAAANLKAVNEPYILAISNMRHHHTSTSSHVADASTTSMRRQEFVSPLFVSKLSKDNRSRSASTMPQKPDVAQDIDSAEYGAAASNAQNFNENHDERVNEILLPLGNALDKVKQFCDIAKHFISDDDVDDDENDSSYQNKASTAPVDTEESFGEVQGRASIYAPSSMRRSSSSLTAFAAAPAIGTGRKVKKLKKKFKKFLLPLLIAYKLKFLTLIPVLIGGLTLLVGTTGLAGFFFALFTAVMSLKSGGGSTKSIVVKKI